MAELKPITFPEHLRHHNLSEQELAPLTDQQKALAKDWNVIKRQSEWMVNEIVELHNIMVEHDAALATWKFWFKVVTTITGGGTGLLALIYWALKQSGGGH